MSSRVVPAALLALCLGACGDKADSADPSGGDGGDGGDGGSTDSGETGGVPAVTGDPATVPLNGTCPLHSKLGGFVVETYTDYAIVDGAMADGVVPVTILEEVGADGGCTLLKRNNPYCEDACESDETCNFDGECIPYPVDQDLGTVTVGGLEIDVIMEPVSPGYSYFFTSLPNPPFADGALVELRTGTGVFAPLELHGIGSSTLVPGETLWQVTEGNELAISWDAPDPNVRTEVAMWVNIDQHGTSPVSLSCVFPDTGSATVPAAMVNGLVASGVTGFPTGALFRRTADKVEVDGGCMDFTVGGRRGVDVRVTGYTPCKDDDDCPEGTTCNQAIEICE